MNKEFIYYEQALALKKIGFNGRCFATWVGETFDMSLQISSDDYFTSAPTYSQAFRWFRDKHKLVLKQQRDGGWWIFEVYDISDEDDCSPTQVGDSILKDTYEEAESACLDKLIEIVKNK